jgi:hypothetical protein
VFNVAGGETVSLRSENDPVFIGEHGVSNVKTKDSGDQFVL